MFKLLVQIFSIFSAKYFCVAKSILLKRFSSGYNFNRTKVAGLLCKFKDLQDLRTQHQDKVALPSLKGGSSHKNRTKKLMK